jgi:hypothetical protein
MRVKYVGPAKRLEVGGKEYHPGDTIDGITEAQLSVLARPPAGTGIHVFEMSDNQEEKVVEETRSRAPRQPSAPATPTEP